MSLNETEFIKSGMFLTSVMSSFWIVELQIIKGQIIKCINCIYKPFKLEPLSTKVVKKKKLMFTFFLYPADVVFLEINDQQQIT